MKTSGLKRDGETRGVWLGKYPTDYNICRVEGKQEVDIVIKIQYVFLLAGGNSAHKPHFFLFWGSCDYHGFITRHSKPVGFFTFLIINTSFCVL